MALTKVSGGILDPGINVAGIVTATGFDGPFTGGSSSNINAGIITATGFDLNGNGDISGNLVIGGNLTANGDFTTLNTTLREVEILRVDANTTAVAGIITQRGSGDIFSVYDTSTEVFKIADGGSVGIGSATPLSTMALDVVGSIRFSVAMRGATGSAATPSYAFYGDHDTGMYRGNGVNILSFATAGTERLNLDADGVATFSSVTGINTGVKIQQTALNYSAGLEINATNGGQAALKLKASKSGTNRATRIDFFNQDSTDPKWTLINDWPQDGSNDFSIRYSNSNKIAINCTPDNQVKLYNNGNVKLETKGYGIDITGGFITTGGSIVNDGGNIKFGTHSDLQIFHDNSNSINVIQSHNGRTLHIDKDNGSANMAKFIPDGAVELYHSGTKKAETFSQGLLTPNNLGICFGDGGCKVTGTAGSGASAGLFFMTNSGNKWQITGDGHLLPKTAAGAVNIGSTGAEIGNVYLADDKRVYFGTDQDLSIYSSGSDSFFENSVGHTYFRNSSGTSGGLLFRSDGETHISNYAADEYRIKTFNNGAVELYYDQSSHATAKLATTATGVSVHGEVATSQDYPNFRPTLDLNFAAEKKLDSRITYQRTGVASFINEFGKIVFVGGNTPRFDHDIVTRESKGLLIEEARTNLAKYSDMDMDSIGGGYYNNVNLARAEGPDGVADSALQVTFTAAGSSFVRSGLIPCSAGVEYTFSVWIKKVSGSFNNSFFSYPQNAAAGLFNSGGFVNTEGQQLSAMPTGVWKRFTQTKTTVSGTTAMDFVMPGYDSNGAVIQYYGLQMEAGAFATSYIPSTDGSSTARGRDIVDIDGEDFTDFYNQSESTIISSHTLLTGVPNAENVYVYQIQDASTNNVIRVIDKNSSYSNVATALILNSGSSVAHFNNTTDSFTKDKVLVALSVKNNDFAASHNGSTAESDTSGTLATNFNSLGIGRYPPSGGYELNGHFQRFIYYPKQLSDSQLKTLTS